VRSRQTVLCVVIGLLLTAATAEMFRTTDLDLKLQSLAYSPGEPHWPYAQRQPWKLLHDYGTWPGLIFALVAIALFAASFTRPAALRWRYPSLFVILLLAVGPGLVTNLLGKVLCGRPRPDEIVPFGGSLRFHRPFELGQPGGGFSFLCGHCSMGYLFVVFFFLRRGAKRWIALAAAMAFGLLIGIGRVTQAAHFPSDVALDGTIMFTIAAALSPVAAIEPRPRLLKPVPVVLAAAVLAGLTVFGFLFSLPVFKASSFVWTNDARRAAATHQTVKPWHGAQSIGIAVDKGDVQIEFAPPGADPLRIEATVKGFGFPNAGVRNETSEFEGGRVLWFESHLTGWYWEAHGHYRVVLPAGSTARVHVITGSR
jgi:membrane-associated PAP2 superfamily phosphatase